MSHPSSPASHKKGLNTAVLPSRASKGRVPRPPLQDWLEDIEDSIQHRLASDFKLPLSDQYRVPSYHGTAPSAARTSQFGNGGTGVTSMGSLPGLASSGTSGYPESLASSTGARDIEHRQRLLIPDGNQGGALTAVPRAVAVGPLECPFKTIVGCRKEFDIDHESQWITHSLSHFKKNGKDVEPPKTNKCCFCDKEILKSTGKESWTVRLKHIRLAHHINGRRMAAARPDFELVRYLWGAHVIDRAVFRDWTARQSNNSPPSSPENQHSPPISYVAGGRRAEPGSRS